MIEIRLEVERPWTASSDDMAGRLRLHRARAELLQRLVEAIGLVVMDWGEALADYPREKVEVTVEAASEDAVRRVVEAAAGWLRDGTVRDIRIGIGGRPPVRPAQIDPAALRPPAQANGGGPNGASTSPVLLMYQKGLEQGNPDVASAIGVILVIFVLVLALIERRIVGDEES
jgi:hypothetical protein